MAKPLSGIEAQHKDRKAVIIAAYKTYTASEKLRVLSIASNDDRGYCSRKQEFFIMDLTPFCAFGKRDCTALTNSSTSDR